MASCGRGSQPWTREVRGNDCRVLWPGREELSLQPSAQMPKGEASVPGSESAKVERRKASAPGLGARRALPSAAVVCAFRRSAAPHDREAARKVSSPGRRGAAGTKVVAPMVPEFREPVIGQPFAPPVGSIRGYMLIAVPKSSASILARTKPTGKTLSAAECSELLLAAARSMDDPVRRAARWAPAFARGRRGNERPNHSGFRHFGPNKANGKNLKLCRVFRVIARRGPEHG